MPYLDRNKWRVQVRVNGTKYSKTFPVGTPKRIADDYEHKLKLSQIDPHLAAKRRQDPMFSEYAHYWLEEHCKVHHSVPYFLKCRQIIVQHLTPALVGKKIRDVTSIDVMNLQNRLRKKDYAVQSINNVLATCSSIFKEAISQDKVSSNPCSGVKRLKKGQQSELQVWTIDERDRFLDVLHEHNRRYFQVCALALFTGLRPSELRGLLRDAVDFERSQLRVHRQWCTKQNELVQYTKTRQARTVPIPAAILECLTEFKNAPEDEQLFPFLCNSFGHRYLKGFMRQADVRSIRMHDFRHTFASHMLLQGATLIEVKEMLGHRKLDSTAIYLHYMPDRNAGATEKLMGRKRWGEGKSKIVSLCSQIG